MFLMLHEIYLAIGAIHTEIPVCHAIRHFIKITAVSLPLSSAIVCFIISLLSAEPQVEANFVVVRAFYTDTVKKSARSFSARSNV